MNIKKHISTLTALALLLSTACAAFAEGTDITALEELKSAFSSSGAYTLGGDINVTNSGITADMSIDGKGHTLRCAETGSGSMIYQNNDINSSFTNVVFEGTAKPEIGIWEGCGYMTLSDCTVTGFSVSTVRRAAIGSGSSGSGKQGTLTLNNVTFSDNGDFDINISDSATVNINEGTTLSKLRLQSAGAKLNIGENWSGEFEITMDGATSRTLGTVADSADISGITVSNEGYGVYNKDGALVISTAGGAELHFDMNSRTDLHHGSTGFLFGAAEINVPTIDLLYGLRPKVMIQKSLGGLQHPTGDSVRTRSSNKAAGAEDIQVYFQDIYLEWPYNAPYNSDGSLNVEGYIETCEQILYGTICDRADKDDEGAFSGNDGSYYKLNKALAEQYSYVLFNEPDNIWYKRNLSGLKDAWKKLYEAIKRIDPDARCAGPNFAAFNAGSYDSFLSYCKANNCLPEIITWHELTESSLTDFYNNYASVVSMVNKYYPAGTVPQIIVNEYAIHAHIGVPGRLVKWLSMFEDKNVDACMAYWAMANSFNELAADQNSPASAWWVYHWYAQMTGSQCTLTSPAFEDTMFYGTTAYDENINMAYVLFGGSEDSHGTETVYLDNMDSTTLAGANGAANVKVYGVSFAGQHGTVYKPDLIFDGAVNVSDNTLKIQVEDTNEMNAYFAVITSTDEEGAQMQDAHLHALSYEAEDAELIGGARAYDKTGWNVFAASGRREVGNINNTGDGVKFTVNVPESGIYNISMFYSLQAPYVNALTLQPDTNGQNRAIGKKLPFGVQIDDGAKETIYLDSTVTWNYRRHYDLDAELTKGEHTITFTQIIEDQSGLKNLILAADIDKLELEYIADITSRYDFEIDLMQETAFRDGSETRFTAVAPAAGYYSITGDGNFSLKKQTVDYAPDANTYSAVTTKDIPVESVVYLSKGANTIAVTGDARILKFSFEKDKTESASTVIKAEEMAIHGTKPYVADRPYAESGKVITELGIGQNASSEDRGEDNYAEFVINAPSAGVYDLAIRYSNDEPAPVMQKTDGSTYIHPYNIDLVERYAQVKINDAEPETVYFRNTMSWDSYNTVDMQAVLNEGENTVKIYNDNSYQFSPLVNSTAPEIDLITIARLSYNGEKAELYADHTDIDTTHLDEILTEAECKVKKTDLYSASSIAELSALINNIKGGGLNTQSDVNKAYNELKSAVSDLRPSALDLNKYYITSFSSGTADDPHKAFDGSVSTTWVANRINAPYVAYIVFYAGDNKVFDLGEITAQGDGNTKVLFLGTNSDSILEPPDGYTDDLAMKNNNLYRPFAERYSAQILGAGGGTLSQTPISGKYRYLIVAATTWSVTNIKELALCAAVEDENNCEAEVDIEKEANSAFANFYLKYNNIGDELYAYFAAYDKDSGTLVSVRSAEFSGDFMRLELPGDTDNYNYKAFIWNKDMKPIN